MNKTASIPFGEIFLMIGMLAGLYLTNLSSYLLFHSLVEIFSIAVAICIFLITWNSKAKIENNFLLFTGISLLFISGIDILHTLAYKGMGVFTGFDANLPTQLWIAARYLQSISLLLAPLFFYPRFRNRLNINLLLLVYSIVFSLVVASIFYWKNFPDCFIEGKGLTDFKIYSEFLISIIMAGSIYLLYKNRLEFDKNIFYLLVVSIATLILSELSFTTYASVYGSAIMFGHLLKFVAYYFIYRAIIVIGLAKPYDLIFRELKKKEVTLQKERDQAQQFLDIAGVMVVVLDANGKIMLINKKGCEILEYTDMDELLNHNWFELCLPERMKGEVRTVFTKLMAGEIEPVEYYENPVVTRTGNERNIAFHNTVLRDSMSKIIGVIFSGEDITERKLAEAELKKYRDHLEELVKERTAELKSKNEELEKFNKLFVGRELRMVELKKKIAELEKNILELNNKAVSQENVKGDLK